MKNPFSIPLKGSLPDSEYVSTDRGVLIPKYVNEEGIIDNQYQYIKDEIVELSKEHWEKNNFDNQGPIDELLLPNNNHLLFIGDPEGKNKAVKNIIEIAREHIGSKEDITVLFAGDLFGKEDTAESIEGTKKIFEMIKISRFINQSVSQVLSLQGNWELKVYKHYKDGLNGIIPNTIRCMGTMLDIIPDLPSIFTINGKYMASHTGIPDSFDINNLSHEQIKKLGEMRYLDEDGNPTFPGWYRDGNHQVYIPDSIKNDRGGLIQIHGHTPHKTIEARYSPPNKELLVLGMDTGDKSWGNGCLSGALFSPMKGGGVENAKEALIIQVPAEY